jgi:hypothetical protein
MERDDIFDINSIKGFEALKNLKTIHWISICDENLLNPLKEKGITIL